MEFPDSVKPLFITTMGQWGPNRDFNVTVATDAAWSSASRAIYQPMWIPFRYHMKRIFVLNGTVVSGNLDLGIYTAGGGLVGSIGSTAQAGTSVPQYANLDLILSPGAYYFACAIDNTTARIHRQLWTVQNARSAGLLQQASAVALPTSMTPAAIASGNNPIMGITLTDSGY